MNKLLTLLKSGLVACAACGLLLAADPKPSTEKTMTTPPKLEKATFGAGCFWGVEYQYAKIPGVHSAESGYAGSTARVRTLATSIAPLSSRILPSSRRSPKT